MITYLQSIDVILTAEVIILIFSTGLFLKEFSILKDVIDSSTTKSLVIMLVSIWLIALFRVIGILSDSILIRTYLSSVAALITAIAYIEWTNQIMDRKPKTRIFLFMTVILGMLSFISGRLLILHFLEIFGIVLIFTTITITMVSVLLYVFKKSPYVRARHRLFVLTISFILFCLFEALAIIQMGSGNYFNASLLFLAELPWRFGITLSILMPQKMMKTLMIFIK